MELHLAGYIVRRGGPAVVSHDYFGDVTIFQISIAKANKFGLLGIKLLVIHVRWFTDSQGRWECSIRDGVPPLPARNFQFSGLAVLGPSCFPGTLHH